MAYIQKRGKGKNTYAVIYSYKATGIHPNGNAVLPKRKPKDEETKSTCNSETDASFFQAIKPSGNFLRNGSLFKL